jgi:hypothetical protein
MFNPLLLDAPYAGALQTIQNQSPYDCSEGLDKLLDLARTIQDSGNYYWQGISFPDSSDLVILPGQTKNGTIQVTPGTYIVALNYFAANVVTFANGAGVKVKLYDKGTKASIFYGDGDFSLDRVSMSNMQVKYGAGNTDIPFGQGYLMSPFIVTPPGIIGWELVSLDTTGTNQIVQVMMSSAVPINKQSIGLRVVGETK